MREAGDELHGRSRHSRPIILEPVEVLGVDDFKESSVTLKFRIKTVPLKQWEVGRELRRRIKLRVRPRRASASRRRDWTSPSCATNRLTET